MTTLADILGDVTTPIKSIADIYVGIKSNQYAQGISNRLTTIEELKATTALLQQQNEAQRTATTAGAASAFNLPEWAKWALLAGGAVLAYKLVK